MGHRSGDGVRRPRLRARAATPPCRSPTRARQGLPRGIGAVALRPGIRRQCNHHGVARHRKNLVQGSPLQKDRDRSVAGHRLKSRATRCTGPRHTQCSSRPSCAPHPCCPLSSASYSTEKSPPPRPAPSRSGGARRSCWPAGAARGRLAASWRCIGSRPDAGRPARRPSHPGASAFSPGRCDGGWRRAVAPGTGIGCHRAATLGATEALGRPRTRRDAGV